MQTNDPADQAMEPAPSGDGTEGQGEGEELEYQTLFIPKDESGYSVPDSGQAMIDFKKVAEDDEGCTIKVTHFESEGGAEDVNEPEEGMDTMDHVDNFLQGQRSKGTGGY